MADDATNGKPGAACDKLRQRARQRRPRWLKHALDKVRGYFTVLAGAWLPNAFDLKPETWPLKPCLRPNTTSVAGYDEQTLCRRGRNDCDPVIETINTRYSYAKACFRSALRLGQMHRVLLRQIRNLQPVI